MKPELYLILHNIRSAYNVGAIFRTADGAGVKKIFLSGYTLAPPNAGKIYKTQAEKMVEKTALGAEKDVSWEKIGALEELLDDLEKQGVALVALEKTEEGMDLKKFKPHFPLALIVGNEVEGIEKNILDRCAAVVSIPMRGRKESLNVSVAAGIAIYEILG